MKHVLRNLAKSKFALPALVVLILLVSFTATYALSSHGKVASQATCQGTCVVLKADSAHPSALAITPGTYVQFNSGDGKEHSLSLGEGGHDHVHIGTFSSGVFKADEAWRVQFKDEGTYSFHDHFNPNITIDVVVYTPGKDYKIQ